MYSPLSDTMNQSRNVASVTLCIYIKLLPSRGRMSELQVADMSVCTVQYEVHVHNVLLL